MGNSFYAEAPIEHEIERPKGSADFKWDVYTITYKDNIYIGITTDYKKRVHTQPQVKALREKGRYVAHFHQLSAAYACELEKSLIQYYWAHKFMDCRNLNPGGEFGKWGTYLDENDPRNKIDISHLNKLKQQIINWVEGEVS